MKSLMIATIFLAGSVTAQEMTSTKDEFNEFAKAMSGRFTAEIKLIHDWPEHKEKRGDIITGIRFGRMIADGEGLMCTAIAGTGIETEMVVYDAGAKQIVGNGISNGGGTWRVVISKESPEKWNWKLTGSLENGEKMTGSGFWQFEDGGKKIHLISDNFFVGGKKAAPLHDKFSRVKN
ncbi:MAG: hypothetical protein GY768_18280 [Planctomycetaceae bacterium]|nr:hypothetical protein [Planctomycetaceae bacterium]